MTFFLLVQKKFTKEKDTVAGILPAIAVAAYPPSQARQSVPLNQVGHSEPRGFIPSPACGRGLG